MKISMLLKNVKHSLLTQKTSKIWKMQRTLFIAYLILEMTVVEVEFSKILGKQKLLLSQRILNLL